MGELRVYDANGALKTTIPTISFSNISGILGTDQGGTGQDFSASTGAILVSGGTMAAQATNGSGNVVRAGSPTITTPTIADLTNMTHSHQNAASGGTLDGAAIAAGTVAAARLGVMTGDSGSGGAKGAVPAPSAGDAIKFLRGDATWVSGTTPLYSNNVLGADTANFDLTSIPATYSHIFLKLYLRSDRAGAAADTIYIRFNNDSNAAHYYSYYMFATTATPTLGAVQRLGATATGFEMGGSAAATAPAGHFGSIWVEIYNYAASGNNHNIQGNYYLQQADSSGNLVLGFFGGLFTDTSAISRITILPVNGSNWKAGSSCELLAVA